MSAGDFVILSDVMRFSQAVQKDLAMWVNSVEGDDATKMSFRRGLRLGRTLNLLMTLIPCCSSGVSPIFHSSKLVFRETEKSNSMILLTKILDNLSGL